MQLHSSCKAEQLLQPLKWLCSVLQLVMLFQCKLLQPDLAERFLAVCPTSCLTSKKPFTVKPRACTTRSGTFSRLNCMQLARVILRRSGGRNRLSGVHGLQAPMDTQSHIFCYILQLTSCIFSKVWPSSISAGPATDT